MKNNLFVLALWCVTLVGACGKEYDLPTEWLGAKHIDVSQSLCAGSADTYPRELPVVAAMGSGKSITIIYDRAEFRCLQEVEGFVRVQSLRHDVLIQPKDMHPKGVAKCDCLYRIDFRIDANVGLNTVTVSRRWDMLGGTSGDVVSIGVVEVNVP